MSEKDNDESISPTEIKPTDKTDGPDAQVVRIAMAKEHETASSVKVVKSSPVYTEGSSESLEVDRIPAKGVVPIEVIVTDPEPELEPKNKSSSPEEHLGPSPQHDRKKVTKDIKESVQLRDTVDASVIPGAERATHYSLNDAADIKDSIGFTPYIKAISKLICHRSTRTPLVIGLYGKWGSGKTTFLKLLKDDVHKHRNVNTGDAKPNKKETIKQVWFNAWRHDVQSDLWIALLQAITTQIERNTPLYKLVWVRFLRLSSIRFYLSLLSIVVLFSFGLVFYTQSDVTTIPKGSPINLGYLDILAKIISSAVPSSVAAVILYWAGVFDPTIQLVKRLRFPLGLDIDELLHGKSLPDKIESFQAFEKQLELRLSDYLNNDGRLIVYIDDLDRCSYNHAVEVIETINLFLDTNHCVFIIGMDNKLIEKGIELKYDKISDSYREMHPQGHSYGQFFLDKIIQLPIKLPVPTPGEIHKYAQDSLLNREPLEGLTNESDPLIETKNNRDASETIIEYMDIVISPETQDAFLTLLPYLEPNPRTIKRFYNMLTFTHYLYLINRKEIGDLNDVALTLWFFLEFSFPQEMQLLRKPENALLSFSDLIEGTTPNFPKVVEFFSDYQSEVHNRTTIMNKLNGTVLSYFPSTRFLAI